MTDSIDNNQQPTVALLNLTSKEGNENQPALRDVPNNGESIETSSRLSTRTRFLQKQTASLRKLRNFSRKNRENSKIDIDKIPEENEKVVFYLISMLWHIY